MVRRTTWPFIAVPVLLSPLVIIVIIRISRNGFSTGYLLWGMAQVIPLIAAIWFGTKKPYWLTRTAERKERPLRSYNIWTIPFILILAMTLAFAASWFILFQVVAALRSGQEDPKFNKALFLPWAVCQSGIAFWLATAGLGGLSLIIAGSVAFLSLTFATKGLSVRKGILGFFDPNEEQVSPRQVLSFALAFAVSFGAVHYSIQKTFGGYSNLNDWQDALYFSVVSLATVGYGDISPSGHYARWACMIEIVCGFYLLVIAVNASTAAWIQKNQPVAVISQSPHAGSDKSN